jgi:hypothetical protein
MITRFIETISPTPPTISKGDIYKPSPKVSRPALNRRTFQAIGNQFKY